MVWMRVWLVRSGWCDVRAERDVTGGRGADAAVPPGGDRARRRVANLVAETRRRRRKRLAPVAARRRPRQGGGAGLRARVRPSPGVRRRVLPLLHDLGGAWRRQPLDANRPHRSR